MATAEIKIKSSFSPNGFDQARGSITKLDKEAQQATHNLSAGFSNIKTGNIVQGIGQITSGIKGFALANPMLTAAAAGFAAIAKGISECVKEYAQAEQTQVRFTQSLNSLGLSGHIQQYSELANIMQKYTGISDEVVKDAMQIGLQMGISASDMEQTIKVAADLSATFGIDLRSAIEMLARAQEGETTQLTRMLPNLKETIKTTKDYSDILGIVGDRVKGAAEAQGNTLAGSMEKLKQSFGDLKETIGSVFAPALKVIVDYATDLLNKINEMFNIGKRGVGKVNVGGQLLDYADAFKNIKYSQHSLISVEGKMLEKGVALEIIKLMRDWGLTIDEALLANQQAQLGLLKIEEIVNYIINNRNKTNETSSPSSSLASTTTTTSSSSTTTETKKEGETFIQMEHRWLKLEELMSEYIEKEEIVNEVVGQTTTNILELSQSISIVSGKFRENERDLRTFGEKLRDNIRSFMSNAFGVDLSSWGGFIMSIVQQMQTFQALRNVMQPIIKMLDAIFKPILMALAPVLQVIYQILAPILQALAPPLILFAVMIANIIQALKALATTIYYVVTLQWNKLDDVKWTAFTPDQITDMIQQSQADIASAAVENPFADVTNTSTTSYSASGARDIYVNIYFNNSYVNGDAREIALKLRDEIRLAEAMGY